ncbi:MAG: TlpA disulfide reductase family protein [Desulfomonilia bacterium]|jgi:peroxiredoxin
MKKKICLAILLSALFIVAALSMNIGVVKGSDTDEQKIGTKQDVTMAPDFSLKDLSGKVRSLKDYRGKVVLLDFTTTWCPYCKKDIPNLKKLHTVMKGKDFELISIYVMESPQKVASFAEKYSLPYTILLDNDATVARTYGVRGVPTKVVVSKNGNIGCWQCTSAEDKIDELLKGK